MTPQVAASDVYPTVQKEVARIAALAEVRSAGEWFRLEEPRFAEYQMEVARIAAPPFGEGNRAAWLADRFREIGLNNVETDKVGNVFAVHPGYGNRYVALSAHIDTVFPAGTPLNVRQQGSRLYGPGVSDNGAGIAAMLAVAEALQTTRIPHALPFVFIGNVGEEGEGDLRGMRHVFATPRWKNSIAYSIVVDGAGSDTVVAEALGSRRFEVIVRGPGGHSWSDFGAPNPIIVLSRTIDVFSLTPVPGSPKTTFNVGVIRGGTSVNSIQNQAAASHTTRKPQAVQSELVEIGNRPAGELAQDARVLKVIRAVDTHLGNAAQVQRASTDANIPLSLGREAIAIGGGGSGGGAHTLQEWFDGNGRDLGLKRILLTMLALAGSGE